LARRNCVVRCGILTHITEAQKMMTLTLSPDTGSAAGILLLTLVAVEYGGWFMLRVVRGNQSATPFQQPFFRTGHAHAGVLVILALVGQILLSATRASGALAPLAGNGIWVAAILIPTGFFVSAASKWVTAPNRWVVFVYVGVGALALGVIALGISLLMG
jgi:hypothetical protein